jgi:formylglycine-generating enzyme required for sulfatase activity
MIPPDFVTIPGGEFLMGENDGDKFSNDTERPRHRVRVSPFRLARFPVTVGEFRRFRPDHEPDCPEDWPATMISWEDAAAYCLRLGNGSRLPSEAEWEFAARAGSSDHYPWGSTISPADANYYYEENGRKVGCGHRTPAGDFPANAFGLLDMVGNVCEWTADGWHPDHVSAPADGSARAGHESGCLRVIRGGAWDYLPRLLRASWRDHLHQRIRRDNVGFRVAADA